MSYNPGAVAKTINIHERMVPRRQRADVFATITATAERIKPYRVTSPAADTLVLTRRVTPTWAVVLAVIGLLVFMLGLLFLLVKTTEVITVRAENVEESVRVTAVGTGSAEMIRFLEDLLAPAPAPSEAG
jgi:hypothetical protein